MSKSYISKRSLEKVVLNIKRLISTLIIHVIKNLAQFLEVEFWKKIDDDNDNDNDEVL